MASSEFNFLNVSIETSCYLKVLTSQTKIAYELKSLHRAFRLNILNTRSNNQQTDHLKTYQWDSKIKNYVNNKANGQTVQT